MQKSIVAFSLGLLVFFQALPAQALSCVTLDMYLDSVINDETTQIYLGTATEVKNHTQVVTVSEALQGWVAPKVWVQHPYSNDWGYFCSNGPAKAGEPTLFFSTIDPYGSFSVVQTLDPDSAAAKDFLKKLEAADVDSGITEATPAERASEVLQSITDVLKALMNMLAELRYWQNA